VTDAGLKQLANLKVLHELHLYYINVTDAGVAGLKRALPDLNINR
jgi:hypothetical protein